MWRHRGTIEQKKEKKKKEEKKNEKFISQIELVIISSGKNKKETEKTIRRNEDN